MTKGRIFVALLFAAFTGCDGELAINADGPSITPPGTQNPGQNNNTPGSNNPNLGSELTESHLRRLTPVQFENTVRHALGDVFEAEDLPSFGDDIPTIGLNNNPSILRINTVNIDSLYASMQRLAQAAVQGTPVVSECVEASNDTCFAEVVDEIGPKLWRRPLQSEERDDLLNTRAELANVASRAEQAEFLIHALLASPNTLFRTELGEVDGEARVLTQFELASALSYTLWNAPPDQELWELAANNQLGDSEILRAQTTRMLEDPRVADALAEFFVDYLKLEAIFTKTKEASLGLTPEAREALVEGVRRDLRQIFSQPNATLLDPFSVNNFHVNEYGATFFGVPVTQGGEYEVVAMDPSERRGILSHPAFLSVHSGEGDTGIVKRGVFTLEQLLCIHLGAPPADISESEDVPEDFDDATATSREVLTVRHSSQPECVSCHRIIDPAGFGYENWDGVGRYREVEKGNVAIDASGELAMGQEVLTYTNSVTFLESLTDSEALRSCIADNFFTYALGDAPKLSEREALYQAFAEADGDIHAVLEALVLSPSFSARKLKEAQ